MTLFNNLRLRGRGNTAATRRLDTKFASRHGVTRVTRSHRFIERVSYSIHRHTLFDSGKSRKGRFLRSKLDTKKINTWVKRRDCEMFMLFIITRTPAIFQGIFREGKKGSLTHTLI